MKAEIITIGNEILSGRINDTNSTYIAQKLQSVGITVNRKISIGDNETDIADAISNARGKSDVIITSGGLGPTADDITKPVIAKVFDSQLTLNQKALENVKRRFSQMNRPMPDINIEQAMVPENCKILDNLYGTAPGIFIEEKDVLFFAIPGVPLEMKYLLDEKIIPILQKTEDRKNIYFREICTTGASESSIGETVSALNFGEQKLDIGFYPNPMGTKIRLTTTALTEKAGEQTLDNATEKILEKLGDIIYSTKGQELEEVIGDLLNRKKLSLAIAESCTGGLIGSRITDIPGSSSYFVGGVISYSNLLKMKALSVKEDTLKKYGAVSLETAREMARGVRQIFKTDVALSVTGIAGPTGGTAEKPVGTVCISLNAAGYEETKKFNFGENNPRTKIKLRSSQAALNMLRLYLQNLK